MSDPTAYGEAVGRAVLKRVGRVAARLQERTPLRADVLESEREYLVVFDAPGVEARDVDVVGEDGSVEVRLERFRDYREGFETLLAGRALSLSGRVELPGDAAVEDDDTRAELTDEGALHVFVPKAERVRVTGDDADADENVDVA